MRRAFGPTGLLASTTPSRWTNELDADTVEVPPLARGRVCTTSRIQGPVDITAGERDVLVVLIREKSNKRRELSNGPKPLPDPTPFVLCGGSLTIT